MLDAQLEREEEVNSIKEITGLSKEEIESQRIAWLSMAVHREDDKGAQLSIQQLVDFGVAETLAEVMGHDDFEGWLQDFNQNFTNDKVTFAELMVALQNCSVDSLQPECNPSTVLSEVAKRLEPARDVINDDSLCEKRKRYADRYDSMVSLFKEWKDLVPAEKQGRKYDVLRGCFKGAECEEIVNALRIVYLDYSALRFAGDLIFKVMKTVVGTSAKRRQN